jgi:hypothetical protein
MASSQQRAVKAFKALGGRVPTIRCRRCNKIPPLDLEAIAERMSSLDNTDVAALEQAARDIYHEAFDALAGWSTFFELVPIFSRLGSSLWGAKDPPPGHENCEACAAAGIAQHSEDQARPPGRYARSVVHALLCPACSKKLQALAPGKGRKKKPVKSRPRPAPKIDAEFEEATPKRQTRRRPSHG